MYEIYIIIVAVVVILAFIFKYTDNFLNIPSFISAVIEFLYLIPKLAYIPIIIAALGFSKLVNMPDFLPMLIIYVYIFIIILINILAYFISTPQIYM